jgi:hypothetical protein
VDYTARSVELTVLVPEGAVDLFKIAARVALKDTRKNEDFNVKDFFKGMPLEGEEEKEEPLRIFEVLYHLPESRAGEPEYDAFINSSDFDNKDFAAILSQNYEHGVFGAMSRSLQTMGGVIEFGCYKDKVKLFSRELEGFFKTLKDLSGGFTSSEECPPGSQLYRYYAEVLAEKKEREGG